MDHRGSRTEKTRLCLLIWAHAFQPSKGGAARINAPMKDGSSFEDFVVAVLKRSMTSWGVADRWFAFAAYFTIFTLPFLVTGAIGDIFGDVANRILAFIATGWLVLLFIVITPYRMWRDERKRAAEYRRRMTPEIKVTYDDKSQACHKTVLHSSNQGETGLGASPSGLKLKVIVMFQSNNVLAF